MCRCREALLIFLYGGLRIAWVNAAAGDGATLRGAQHKIAVHNLKAELPVRGILGQGGLKGGPHSRVKLKGLEIDGVEGETVPPFPAFQKSAGQRATARASIEQAAGV